MFRIFIALTLIFLSTFKLSAQDVLIDKKGNELPCKLVGADKRYFSYKGYQDPEFTTRKTPISKYKKIRYADGKEFKISPPPSGWLFIGTGPSIPLGSYASSDINDQFSGFAKTGTGLQMEGAFPAFGKKKQWSILGMIGGFNNDVDYNEKLSWYQSNQGFVGSYGNNSKTGRWNMGVALMGVGYTIPLSWKFSLDQKIGLGVGLAKKGVDHYSYSIDHGAGNRVNYQYYSYGSIDPKGNGMDTLKRAQSTTMTFLYGAAIRFNITRSLALRFGADFLYASPTFKVHQYVTPDPPTGQAFDPNKAETVHSKISVVRVSIGVCFNLIPKNIDYGIPK